MRNQDSPAARLLREDELDRVSGGFKEVDSKSPWMNPLVIRGFNPQPDPPGVGA